MNSAYSHKEILKELRRILAQQRRIYPKWVEDAKNPLSEQEALRRNALMSDAIEIISNAEGETSLFEQKGGWYEPRKWRKLPDGNYLYMSHKESAYVNITTEGKDRKVTFFFWSNETDHPPTCTMDELVSAGAMLYGPIPDNPAPEAESGFGA